MLEIKDIRKTYRTKKGTETKALDGVSISFPEKGLVFILGRSGCGKSTLLNICGGLDRADEGEIIVKGRSSADFTPTDFDSYRNTCVGFVFQEYNILDEFTVEENISIALELQNKKKDAQKVAEILRSVDLDAFARRRPNTLSGGQKQRVAIARALVKDPEIIFADEPTGALDSETGRQVLDTLKKLSKEKLVVAVSHDREFAEQYADRIIELKDGKIISDVTRTGENKEIPNVCFFEDTIAVRDCAVLTEEDFAAIRRFLSSSRSGAMLSCNRAEVVKAQSAMPEAAGKFEETKPQTVQRAYAAEEQNFIRSRMPFRHAFRMGASCVRTRPVRLVFSIFLCLIAFVMFGMFSTVMFYDEQRVAREALEMSGAYYLAYNKAYAETVNTYTNGELTRSESSVTQTGMTEAEYASLQQRYTGTLAVLFPGARHGFPGSDSSDTRFFDSAIAGYVYSEGNKDLPALLWGNYPQNANEAAISDYTFASLCHTGYSSGGETFDIESYEDLKKLPVLDFGSAKVRIVGVYAGEKVPEKYEELRRASLEQTYYEGNLDYEWQQTRASGFYSYLLMHDSFTEQFRSYLAEEEAEPERVLPDTYFMENSYSLSLYSGSNSVNLQYFNVYTKDSGLPLLSLYSVADGSAVSSPGEGGVALHLQTYAKLMYYALESAVDDLYDNLQNTSLEEQEKIYECYQLFNYGDDRNGIPSISDILEDLADGSVQEQEEIAGSLTTVTSFMQKYGLAAPSFRLSDRDEEVSRTVNCSAFFCESFNDGLNYCAYLPQELFDAFYRGDGVILTENVTKYVSPEDAFISGTFVPDFQANGALDELTSRVFSVADDDSTAIISNKAMNDAAGVSTTVYWLRWFTLGVGLSLTLFAVLLMFNFISASITSKKKEIGILRAIGARATDVYKIFFSEALIVAGICFVLAAIICGVLAPVFSGLIVESTSLTVNLLHFGLLSVLFMAFVALFTAAISTLVPVAIYSKKPPVESIRAL